MYAKYSNMRRKHITLSSRNVWLQRIECTMPYMQLWQSDDIHIIKLAKMQKADFISFYCCNTQ